MPAMVVRPTESRKRDGGSLISTNNSLLSRYFILRFNNENGKENKSGEKNNTAACATNVKRYLMTKIAPPNVKLPKTKTRTLTGLEPGSLECAPPPPSAAIGRKRKF